MSQIRFISLLLLAILANMSISQSVQNPAKEHLILSYTGPEWQRFFREIKICSERLPDVFLPLELTRIDLLPQDQVDALVRDFYKKFLELDTRRQNQLLDELRRKTSCQAAEAFDELRQSEEKKQKRSLLGTYLPFKRAIPEENRSALTIVDEIFLKSNPIGQKILKELQSRPQLNLEATRVFPRKGIVEFQGKPAAWNRSPLPAQTYYTLKITPSGGSQILARGKFSDSKEPTSPDLRLSRNDLIGKFFNPSSKSPSLFGPYPGKKDLWVDPQGHSHYEGDGHSH